MTEAGMYKSAKEKKHGMTASKVLDMAKRVLRAEADAIAEAERNLSGGFVKAVEMVLNCKGKIVIVGIGKSGLVGRKIVSTFVSTGTPAYFLHPAEGVHGDLGILSKDDLVIAISKSGSSNELLEILPVIKRLGIPLISITSNSSSTLADKSDIVIDIGEVKEACPMGLVPTSSTAATMAVGDALAVVVFTLRGFKEEDLALVHPGGAIGRKLLLRVEDLMHTGDEIPLVKTMTSMKETIYVMTSKRLGITGVLDDSGKLVGVITDGDLRRGLEKYSDILSLPAQKIMTSNPKWICQTDLAAKALQKMEAHAITCLFVFKDETRQELTGIIHMHDLLKAGVA